MTVAVLQWLVVIPAIYPLRLLWGVGRRCLQVVPLLPPLRLHMAVWNLIMYVDWQRWTRSRRGGMGFACRRFEWCCFCVCEGARCSVVDAAVASVLYVLCEWCVWRLRGEGVTGCDVHAFCVSHSFDLSVAGFAS